MEISLQKWGNSLGIRIPAELTKRLGMSTGTNLEINIQGDHIIIRKKISLSNLLSEINEENKHEEILYDEKTLGKEIW